MGYWVPYFALAVLIVDFEAFKKPLKPQNVIVSAARPFASAKVRDFFAYTPRLLKLIAYKLWP